METQMKNIYKTHETCYDLQIGSSTFRESK